ncbi:Uncharacterized protein dnl_23350 [Desulfonema limicola]|uniref:Uncharacterized protein n=1 Tax=Desulfonema limicola TaxID=45656 RepID=A0A975B788_9BACT|nr:hypothetical protein [Desulfonema limicola]QTA80049.1 Uncharacterized protein dnl_23350 [Desulfonema limicola]
MKQEQSKEISAEVREIIEALEKIRKETTFDISSKALSKLPPHVVKTVLDLKRKAKNMNLKLTAAAKIKKTSPEKKHLKLLDEILEIDPDKTLRASLTPDELKQLKYRKKEKDDK